MAAMASRSLALALLVVFLAHAPLVSSNDIDPCIPLMEEFEHWTEERCEGEITDCFELLSQIYKHKCAQSHIVEAIPQIIGNHRRIQVKNEDTGKTFHLWVEPNVHTIADVKAQIKHFKNIPMWRQRLTYYGKTLQSGIFLSRIFGVDYNYKIWVGVDNLSETEPEIYLSVAGRRGGK